MKVILLLVLLSLSISCSSTEIIKLNENAPVANTIVDNIQAKTQLDETIPNKAWRLKTSGEDSITLKLPPEFVVDHSFSWTTLATKITEMQKVDEKDIVNPNVTVNLTQTSVYKVGKNLPIYTQHAPQERLTLIFKNFQADADAVDKLRRGEPIQYRVNRIKGILQKSKRKDQRESIIWTTFRYFGNEIQRVWIEIDYQKTDSEKARKILDSVKFGDKKSDLLTAN